ncbi:MAG: tail fiber domain-containing protein [Salinivirgaceae bacterium]|nr:tail fiber domain-containing protein [Salinivirgaceae bacterium]
MKRKFLFAAAMFCCAMSANAQLKVYKDGSVMVDTKAGNWARAFYTKVYSPYSCAYHLRYNNEDVFYVCAEGWIWCKKGGYFGSDYKLKKNIHKIHSPLETVKKLNGVQYDYTDTLNHSEFKNYKYSKLKDPLSNKQRIGLIAQEVETVLPGVVKMLDDSTKAISYTDIIALLVEAVKEQQQLFTAQSEKIKELEKEIASNGSSFKNPRNGRKYMAAPSATDKDEDFDAENETNESTFEDDITTNAFLFQNTPNPFSTQTEIRYFLPENVENACIYVFSLNGNLLLTKPITQLGNGSIIISNSELSAGMYIYTLAINGVEVDSKRMILNRK